MISENLLKEINDAYSRLEARMTAAVSVLKLSKLEVEYGWYNNHYNKSQSGEWIRDAHPISVIGVKGLCDVEISFLSVTVSTKLSRTQALEYSYDKLAGYDFEAYGVQEYLSDYYIKGQTFGQLKENIRKSNELEIGFSFTFPEDIGTGKICEFVSLLQSEGFYY